MHPTTPDAQGVIVPACAPWIAFLQFHGRKVVDTAGRLTTERFPKSIHSVTARDFELKVFLCIVAYNIHYALQAATFPYTY